MKRVFIPALLGMLVLGFSGVAAPPAHAVTVWEQVDVRTAPYVDTMADGTQVTISFGPAAGVFTGFTPPPPAYYQTNASAVAGVPVTNSTVRFTFSQPITNLRVFYAFVGWGDQEALTTNLGPVDLAQTVAQGGNLVSSSGNFVAGQPEGSYSSNGIISATSSNYQVDANSAVLELEFPSGITYLEARGAPDATAQANGLPGANLIGLALPVTSYTVQFDANGGQGSMADETVYGDATLPANTFTRTGFTFTGWNTQADGTGTSYANEGAFPQSDVTLYAQWRSTELAQTGSPSDNGSALFVGLMILGGLGLLVSRRIARGG